jgi:transcriptional regulator with XRE-family HTH domain
MGRRIYRRRRELGLTQVDLLARLRDGGLSLTPGAISHIEDRGVDMAKAPVFALALECTVSFLAGWTDDPDGWEPNRSLAKIVEQIAESVQRIRCNGKRAAHLRLVPSR